MILRVVIVLALGLFCVPVYSQSGAALPSFRARTLSGSDVELPAVFSGKVGILLIGFSKKSSAQTSVWGQYLAGLAAKDGNVLYYECAILGDVPSFIRGFVIGQIRKAMPQPERERFLPLTQAPSEWKQVVGEGGAGDAYLVVVGAGGRVVYRTHGASSASLQRDLAACVARMKHQPEASCL